MSLPACLELALTMSTISSTTLNPQRKEPEQLDNRLRALMQAPRNFYTVSLQERKPVAVSRRRMKRWRITRSWTFDISIFKITKHHKIQNSMLVKATFTRRVFRWRVSVTKNLAVQGILTRVSRHTSKQQYQQNNVRHKSTSKLPDVKYRNKSSHRFPDTCSNR